MNSPLVRSVSKPIDPGSAWVLPIVMLLAAVLPVSAGGQTRLLEPERAFAFSVQAVDEKTIEARFSIADGYYLYREKVKFAVEPVKLANAPLLPPGKVKDDAFFGNVETYRGQLVVRLPLDGAQPGAKVTVKAESQGCADAGVCYPPQVQTLTVALPTLPGRPGEPVSATPKKSWFN